MTRLAVENSALADDMAISMDEVAPRPSDERPDYLERNRTAWELWAPKASVSGAKAWREDELLWGLWRLPESQLQLLHGLPAKADVVELGCGTGAVSGWVARSGMHPVGVDLSASQLRTAERLQHEFGVSFPLIHANAEQIPFDRESFDAAISEYGASVWCNPRRWLPEAYRLLRPGGRLIFFTSAAMLMTCTSRDGGHTGSRLARDYFSSYRVEFGEATGVEFHMTHGQWIRLLRAAGFVLENLIEPRPPADATPRYDFVPVQWARRWPTEEIWVVRKPRER